MEVGVRISTKLTPPLNANGVAAYSPGLGRGTSAYPGFSVTDDANPNGVAAACETERAP